MCDGHGYGEGVQQESWLENSLFYCSGWTLCVITVWTIVRKEAMCCNSLPGDGPLVLELVTLPL